MWFKHRNRRLIAASFIVLSSLGAGLSLAGCHHSPEDRANWVTHKISRELDLTAPQQEKLDAIKKEFLLVREGFTKRRTQAIDTLITQVKSKKLDEAQLKAMVDAHQQSVEEASPKIIALIADFHGSLTDAQKTKIAEKLEKFRKHLE